MKHLAIGRYSSVDPITLADGDSFDSSAVLHDDNDKELWNSEHVNTDPTVNYKGGIMAPQEMYGILHHKYNSDGTAGRECIRLFNKATDLTKIKTGDDLTDENKTLVSLIANPNHAGAFIVRDALVHSCGTAGGPPPTWDWSHACCTIWNITGECDKLLVCLKPNEIILVQLF